MSIYKRQNQSTYSYDFRFRGCRYSGSTGCSEKRTAERYEAEIKQKTYAQQEAKSKNLTVASAFSRYWIEVAQHHKNSSSTLTDLAWLERQLGKSKLLSSISSNDVAFLISRRRADKVKPATINRSVTQRLRAVLTRAKNTWGANIRIIKWGDLILPEPQERVRELSSEEESALFDALRKDYHPIVKFALLSGCRKAECCSLTWRQIDWNNQFLTVVGKGNRARNIPITPEILDLLKPLPRAHGRVFTFKSQRADFAPRGSLNPIEMNGLRSVWDLAIKKSGIENFRFHDLRHTCATRLLRNSGNLRLPQRLLGHSDIKTTLKYAHATMDDLRDAMIATQNATKRTIVKRNDLNKKDKKA